MFFPLLLHYEEKLHLGRLYPQSLFTRWDICMSVMENTSPEESSITQLPFLDLTSVVEVLSLDLSRIFHLILAFPKALSAPRD